MSITIRIISRWCVPIADIWPGAWPIRTAAGWAAGGLIKGKPGPATTPPYPRVAEKQGACSWPGLGIFLSHSKPPPQNRGGYRKNRGA